MERTYRVAEFARLAGVTVRTLHYYDRIDLLKPSDFTEGGHRCYRRKEVLRLQQILTLKWMGFTLQQIKTILDSPTYDLCESLSIQKAAVDARIARLNEASAALAKALEATEGAGTDELDAEMVSAIIRGVTMVDSQAWVRRYYSDGAWAGIVTRRFSYSSEQLEEAQRAWQDLFAAFERHRGQPPDSPDVQALAGQMNALIEGFTGGDPEAEAGLERFARDAEKGNVPPELAGYAPYGGADEDLHRFMQQALTTYRERRQK